MKIVNIVTSGSLGQKVNLLNLLKAFPGDFSYDPEGYNGGYLKLSKYTATIYSSGKYIIPGVNDIDDIESNYIELKSKLNCYLDVNLIEKATVKNIVAYSLLDCQLDLVQIAARIMSTTDYSVSYEPEVFAGLCLKTDLGSANVYRNGKYILLGTSSVDQLLKFDKQIRSLLAQ